MLVPKGILDIVYSSSKILNYTSCFRYLEANYTSSLNNGVIGYSIMKRRQEDNSVENNSYELTESYYLYYYFLLNKLIKLQ